MRQLGEHACLQAPLEGYRLERMRLVGLLEGNAEVDVNPVSDFDSLALSRDHCHRNLALCAIQLGYGAADRLIDELHDFPGRAYTHAVPII